MTYRLTEVAEQDINEISDYIAQGSLIYAQKTIDRFREIFLLLMNMPQAGTPRDDLIEGLRSYATGNYVIFYHLSDEFVVIDRVLHSARDIDSIIGMN